MLVGGGSKCLQNFTLHALKCLQAWNIFQIDFVVVLVLKCVQTTIAALFKQELRQVARRNEVVRLRVER